MMPQRNILSEMISRVARAGRRGHREQDISTLDLCHDLLGDKGEVSGLISAMTLLERFEAMNPDEQKTFFQDIAASFGVDEDKLADAVANWSRGDALAARNLHAVAEPRSQELIRRINRVPGATARLVKMRAALLAMRKGAPDLAGMDDDFRHLFASWFNRGFLEIRRIDWSTSAEVLEKIIAYEAVHEITGWDDLRQRVAAPDRRLFAFFHPAMPADPLIFVEVALSVEIPNAIGPILAQDREPANPIEATTAVFYSISNCQPGLRGISFGNFLIKQVVAELQGELSGLKQFVTLSPVPGLRKWVTDARKNADPAIPVKIAEMTKTELAAPLPAELAIELAARYLTLAKLKHATALDPVAHFHLGNGAMLYDIHADADQSQQGQENSWGVMVNYLYDEAQIGANHQLYSTEHQVVAAPKVRVLAGLPKK